MVTGMNSHRDVRRHQVLIDQAGISSPAMAALASCAGRDWNQPYFSNDGSPLPHKPHS